MKKIAVIDCGSNSFRMLIANVGSQHFDVIKREYQMVMLGKNLTSKKGLIDEESFRRGIDTLKEFKMIINEFDCHEYYCIGTSALRTAINSDEFVKTAKVAANMEINIISEQDEAMYSFYGSVEFADQTNQYAVLDIGGGSSEVIYLKNSKLTSYSMLLGAARLKNMFWPRKNTPSDLEYEKANKYVTEVIKHKNICMGKKKLLGVAGTITSLAAISKKMKRYEPEKINNTILSLKNVKSMLLYIMRLDEKERSSIPGMFPSERANNIIAGIIILIKVMEALAFDEIKVKSTGILEGILLIKFFDNNIDK